MPPDQVTFNTAVPGLIQVEISGPGAEPQVVGQISVEVWAERKPLDLKWEKIGQAKAGLLSMTARADELILELKAEKLEDEPLINLALSIHRGPQGKSINCGRLNLDFMPGAKPVEAWEKLDDLHVPHLTRWPGIVMGDQIFRTPAIIVRRGGLALALLPDLDALAQARPAPWFMDFERVGPANTPRLALGIMRQKPYRHVYFEGRPDQEIEIPPEGLKLSGHLIASAEAGPKFTRRVQGLIWERYGQPNYLAVKPQVLPLDDQARAALDRLFKRDDLYFEFDYQGKTRAGVVAHAATTKKVLKPLGKAATAVASPLHGIFILSYLQAMNSLNLGPKVEDFLRRLVHDHGIPFIRETQFSSWFNDLRTAYGARVLAEKWGDQRLLEQADRIKDLALAAPVEDGIFAAVCTFPKGKVSWKRGTLTFMAIDDYHTPDQATTAYLMLRWYRDIEPDPALLEMTRGLGRFFLKHQLSSGAVPAWLKGGTHQPLPRLLESASTAGPMMFMAKLAAVDGDEKVLESAKRMAAFIERTVLPEHKWFDYETFYSCTKQPQPIRDPRTGVLPANSMSMCWATEGMRLLYELTGEQSYRELMLRCLDDLLWRQQVWDAPYISINTFGGFCCINTDAEWNDARQGMIAPVLMDCYGSSGDPAHFQRGVAALRASYTTMLHPAMREVAPGNMVHYRESDRGAIYENYGHIGIDRVIAGYLEPDWGAGTAAFATAHAAKFYGDLFVDLIHGHAFGINGCAVKNFEKKGDTCFIDIDAPVPIKGEMRVVVKGAGPDTKLMVNEKLKAFELLS